MDELRKLVDQWDADPEFALTDEIAFLESVWRCADVPLRTRVAAAQTVCKFKFPELKAVAHVTNKDSASAMIDRARERAAPFKIVKLEIVPAAQRALPPSQHDAAELKPNASSATNGGQTSGAFRRRI
jgi:hypothetical protein